MSSSNLRAFHKNIELINFASILYYECVSSQVLLFQYFDCKALLVATSLAKNTILVFVLKIK